MMLMTAVTNKKTKNEAGACGHEYGDDNDDDAHEDGFMLMRSDHDDGARTVN